MIPHQGQMESTPGKLPSQNPVVKKQNKNRLCGILGRGGKNPISFCLSLIGNSEERGVFLDTIYVTLQVAGLTHAVIPQDVKATEWVDLHNILKIVLVMF